MCELEKSFRFISFHSCINRAPLCHPKIFFLDNRLKIYIFIILSHASSSFFPSLYFNKLKCTDIIQVRMNWILFFSFFPPPVFLIFFIWNKTSNVSTNNNNWVAVLSFCTIIQTWNQWTKSTEVFFYPMYFYKIYIDVKKN